MGSQFDYVMSELEAREIEHTKMSHISRGIQEPLFGVALGAIKKIMKKTALDQNFANELYETGNHDACISQA